MKPSKYINKRGSYGIDLMVYLVIGLFLFALITFIGHKIWISMSESIDTSMLDDDDTDAKSILQSATTTLNMFDYLFVVVLVLMGLGLVISVYFIDSHPIFFGITLFVFLIFLFLSILISDIFTNISSSDTFANETATYSMTNYVFQHMPLFMAVIGVIVIIVMFAKFKGAI
jgi:magnesium-transporting ATPase (P-type)